MTVAKRVFLMCILLTPPLAGKMIAADTDHPEGLRFASYATSRHVERLATDQIARAQALSAIRRLGITKLYVEVYRGGHVVSREHLIFVRDWLRDKGLDAVGGIATVPGGNFGVRQEGPLGWFNWEDEKTWRDLEKVIRTAAGIFDTFIVDDFLCTGDVSAQSRAAKGNRSWGEYRRALLTEVALSVFVGPAKEVNPSITMIVKYPQWYDRFHLFGYDTRTLPEIFDKVWVGTETRGRNTQRFGFVQPYEGFVNYRWLSAIAGEKIGGAWFDHGDCSEHDFLDQAYTSVLAGARELVFFNFDNVISGHPDHDKIVAQSRRLTELAAFVGRHPVVGVPAYKPANSDPAGDMYIMDFLGMLGIPIIPVHEFPQGAGVIFLPAQAAADPNLLDHIERARKRGAHLILTTSLVVASADGDELARMTGVGRDTRSEPTRARLSPESATPYVTVDIESPIEFEAGPRDIACTANNKQYVFLKVTNSPQGRVALLNTHTYNQADFDAVGEVLLCPRPLGLLEMRSPALSILRDAFGDGVFDGPAGVTYHPFDSFASGNCVIQNFNDKTVNVTLTPAAREGKSDLFVEAFSGKPVPIRPVETENRIALDLVIPARGRAWVRREQAVRCAVEVEEVVTKYAPANNGAGPLWCYGSTVIARGGDEVYLSTIETGQDVPPLCNTRWQLWHRSADGWKIAQSEQEYRQREPCPIAVFQRGPVFMSVNPSTEPVGTQYGPCKPLVLEFDRDNLAAPAKTNTPAWADGTYFTDHSYRGFAADGADGELLLVNINARTGDQFVSHRDETGRWYQKGKITFPIRSCYPQVALRNGAAHIMAIGDIVEPVEQWRKLKFEKLKRKWDYVFRRLFYTYSSDIKSAAFRPPVEIDTVEQTGGHIRNLDMHIDKSGAAHLLYLKQPHQYAFLRDKYFPGRPMTIQLEYVIVRDGKVISRRTLAQGPSESGLEPSFARFHVDSSEKLHVIAAGAVKGTFGNYIARIGGGPEGPHFQRIVMKHPFRNFFTNTPRGGSQPSDVIDLFGIADDNPNLRYAQIRIETAGD